MVDSPLDTTKASFSGIYFTNVHFLGLELGLMSLDDDLCVIMHVVGWRPD